MPSDNSELSEKSEIEHFNKTASNYDQNYGYHNAFTQYKISKKIAEFIKFVNSTQGKFSGLKILDLGCGTGEYTQHIARELPDCQITGLDISEGMVDEARQKSKQLTNVQFVVQSAYQTEFGSGEFDVVCGFYILHHLDLEKSQAEIHRILKPSGSAFFYEPNILNPYVYAVKSIPSLKVKAGDSPDEWAINPLTIKKIFYKFKTSYALSEFILPLGFIPYKLIVFMDNLFSFFGKIPLVKYFGGSVQILLQK